MIYKNRYRKWAILISISLASGYIFSQKTTAYDQRFATYQDALDRFDLGIFAESERLLESFITRREPIERQEHQLAEQHADYIQGLSGLYRDDLDAEKVLLDFIDRNRPDPIADLASIDLGNFYFNTKNYKKALQSYANADSRNLTTNQLSELKFKQGYCYFVNKDFDNTILALDQVRQIQNRYYYPSNYYHGISHYYQENFDQAIASFDIVERSPTYAKHIPYYKANILSSQSRWDDLIDYLPGRLNDPKIKNEKELNQLLGQAYFERKQYIKALPYLEFYDQKSGKMRAEDFFQLGYAQYVAGKYQAAKTSFLEITNQDNKLGQNANFYLADCYIKNGDKSSARNAFAKANKLDYDSEIKEEALFNYGLLSAELGDDRSAVNALTAITENSKYHLQAQETLGKVFLYSQDYANALRILERIPRNTNTLKESYQKITYFYALQSLNDKKPTLAKELFNKSIAENANSSFTRATYYWLGYMEHGAKNYDTSIEHISRFISDTSGRLPSPDATITMANYIQGYNYFQKKNYRKAAPYFESAASGNLAKAIKNDLYIRWGDCLLKQNKYQQAFATYESSQKFGTTSADYALFQQGLIRGLTHRNTEKIVLLNRLISDYPSSNLVDDALFELGTTYIEQSRPTEAINSFTSLVNDHKNTSNLVNRAYLKLGLLSYNQGDSRNALKNYSTLLSNNPSRNESAEAISAIEEIYIEDLNDPQGYEKFLETFPAFKLGNAAKDSLNYRVAYSLYEDGEYDQAIGSFGDYLTKFPAGIQRIDALFFRAESKTILKQYQPAFTDYKALIELGSSHRLEDALYKAALISYNHNKDFGEAFTLYNRLSSIASNDKVKFEAQVGALQSAFRIGNDKAVLDYANLVVTNPGATKDQKGSAYFYRAKVAQQREDYKLALQGYNQCTKEIDNVLAAEARYQISAIYYKQRHLDLTETYGEQAIKKNASYPYWVAKSLILLSDVLRDKGDLFNARAALEAVIENYHQDETITTEAKARLTLIESLELESTRIDNSESSDTLQLKENE